MNTAGDGNIVLKPQDNTMPADVKVDKIWQVHDSFRTPGPAGMQAMNAMEVYCLGSDKLIYYYDFAERVWILK